MGIEQVSRRKFLGAAAASAGLATVAGCASGIDPEGVPPRPGYGADPSALDPVLRFVVLSVHYQNLYFDNGEPGRPRPQRPAGGEDDRELRFILDSLDYQNAYIEAEVA